MQWALSWAQHVGPEHFPGPLSLLEQALHFAATPLRERKQQRHLHIPIHLPRLILTYHATPDSKLGAQRFNGWAIATRKAHRDGLFTGCVGGIVDGQIAEAGGEGVEVSEDSAKIRDRGGEVGSQSVEEVGRLERDWRSLDGLAV